MDIPAAGCKFSKVRDYPTRKGIKLPQILDRVGGGGPNSATTRTVSKIVRELVVGEALTTSCCPDFTEDGYSIDTYFNPWYHGISPEWDDNKKYYKKDVESMKNVPKRGEFGVYEIAVSLYYPLPVGQQPIVIYCGQGDLKDRIVYSYCTKAGKNSLKAQLTALCKIGFHVYFRWMHSANRASAQCYEQIFLKHYDYAFQKEYNVRCRDVDELAWIRAGKCVSIVKDLQNLVEVLDVIEKEEACQDVFDNMLHQIAGLSLSADQREVLNSILVTYEVLPATMKKVVTRSQTASGGEI